MAGFSVNETSVCHKLLLVFFIEELIERQVVVVKRIHNRHRGNDANGPQADIIGERIETSLLSPGFHPGVSCFLPAAA
jgi:hypothetical protein